VLSLLLDENISHEVAVQLKRHAPTVRVESVHSFEGGRLRSAGDETILLEAARSHLTLVTYNVATVPELLVQLAESGTDHGGVIFADSRTVPPHRFGLLTRSLLQCLEKEGTHDWTNRILFLRAAP
jgi:hypothetical protein